MKIAVIQMMYPKGHLSIDEEYVRILSKEHQLIIVDNGKYFKKQLDNNLNIEHIKVFQPMVKRCEKLKSFLRFFNLLIVLCTLIIRKKNYDVLLFLNIHCELYKISSWLPNKKKILIHHNDIDALLEDSKSFKSFEREKTIYRHIFLADYISQNFSSLLKVDSKLVFTVHEPVKYSKFSSTHLRKDLLICMGNNTVPDFIDANIELDKENHGSYLSNKLIMRSTSEEYIGTNLQVIKGYLSNADYEKYFDEAKVSVVFYPDNYKYRYSGVIDDSLNKGLVVFCNDTLCGRYFSSIYPGSVKIINDAKQLWEIMKYPLPEQPQKEYEYFCERHSDAYVLKQFNKVIYS